jgi:hypothetical protein
MKKLFAAILASLIVSGCAQAPKFDNVEYDRFVGMLGHVQYTTTLCGEYPIVVARHTQQLVHEAAVLDIYATYRPSHKEIKEITSLLLANVKEMDAAYTNPNVNAPSTAYCLGKLKVMENSLKRVLPVMGGLMP